MVLNFARATFGSVINHRSDSSFPKRGNFIGQKKAFSENREVKRCEAHIVRFFVPLQKIDMP